MKKYKRAYLFKIDGSPYYVRKIEYYSAHFEIVSKTDVLRYAYSYYGSFFGALRIKFLLEKTGNFYKKIKIKIKKVKADELL